MGAPWGTAIIQTRGELMWWICSGESIAGEKCWLAKRNEFTPTFWCESGDALEKRGLGLVDGGAVEPGGQSTATWSFTGLEIKVSCPLCLSCRY